MAKKKSSKVAVSPQTRAALRKALLWGFVLVVIVGGATAAMLGMRRYVERDVTMLNLPPRLVLKERPAWMSDALANQILDAAQPAGVHSSFDREVLKDVADILRGSAWVKEIHEVRRVYSQRAGDTILVDCDFRAPVALVHWKDYYWLVDAEGFKLPEQFTQNQIARIITGKDGRVNLRVIEGVQHAPVESGERWPGNDLGAGLELARCLNGLPFTNEIIKINVANYDGRVDPRQAQIALITNKGSQIRWGLPVSSKDGFVEVPASQKLVALKQIYSQFGHVDANRQWIDIRLDKITYPAEQASAGEP